MKICYRWASFYVNQFKFKVLDKSPTDVSEELLSTTYNNK